MWILKNLHSEECYYLLDTKDSYSVGRAGTNLDITLRGDTSISRTHAILHLTGAENQNLKLEDLNSKFGTYHNGIRMEKAMVTLRADDQIRFGLLKNVWTVSHMPLVSIASALSRDQVVLFEQYLSELGGKVLQQWSADCTHLTMTEVTITVKVLHALLEQIPIVTCDYWRELLQSVRQRDTSLPAPTAYTPRCSESIIHNDDVDLRSRPERKSLFKGTTFVFMNRKHHDMYGPIVQKAGANYKDLNTGGGVHKSFLVKNNVIVIQYVPSTQSQSTETINSIEDYLGTHSLRIIPEYEIGLAILHCSREKYCNPSYKILNDLMPSSLSIAASTSPEGVLIRNTHVASCAPSTQLSDIIIPETEAKSRTCSKTPNVFGSRVVDSSERDSSHEEEESMPAICITDSVSEQQQIKRKYQEQNAVSDSDDETLFQFAKKQHLENNELPQNEHKNTRLQSTKAVSKSNKKSPSMSKPLPIESTTSGKAKRTSVNVSGFLEKPQAAKNQEKSASSQNKPAAENQPQSTLRKRPLIAIITEDDDDDLFNFGDGATSNKKSRQQFEDIANNSDEELFGFTTQSRDCVDKSSTQVDLDNEDLMPTEPFNPQLKSKSLLMKMPKPLPLPKKISTAGWLSCKLEKVKLETDNKKTELVSDGADNEDTKDDLLAHKKWVETLKNACQVNICTFDLTTHTKDSLPNGQTELGHRDERGELKRPNFKKFVKRYRRSCRTENRPTC